MKNNSKEFLTFNTELLSLKPRLQVGVSGLVQGRTVVLKGMFLIPDLDTVPKAILYRGIAGTPYVSPIWMHGGTLGTDKVFGSFDCLRGPIADRRIVENKSPAFLSRGRGASAYMAFALAR